MLRPLRVEFEAVGDRRLFPLCHLRRQPKVLLDRQRRLVERVGIESIFVRLVHRYPKSREVGLRTIYPSTSRAGDSNLRPTAIMEASMDGTTELLESDRR